MKTKITDNVVFLPTEESGSRGFIRSKSGWVWEYTPDTARKRAAALEANCFDGPMPTKTSTSNKYTKDKRNEDNERVIRGYRLR
jgi:hypothetical protein